MGVKGQWNIEYIDNHVRQGWIGWNRVEPLNDEGIVYIHPDGIYRRSTKHNGVFSGYFGSREEVKAAIMKGLGR